MPQDSKTGIEVTIDFVPHGLFLFPPTLLIDRQPCKILWGTHFFPAEPGRHSVTLRFMYFFMPWRFEDSVEVAVEKDKVSKIEYWGPPWRLGKRGLRAR